MPDADNSPRILILIPAYNAGPFLTELADRIRAALPRPEMLVVNDGSTDTTVEVLAFNNIPSIRLPENRGKGAALKVGMNYARENGYDGVLTIDADLQHLPEELPQLIASFDPNSIIVGQRDLSLSRLPAQRWLTNRWSSIVVSVMANRRIHDSQCGFRLIPISLLARTEFSADDYDFETELLLKAAKAGFNVRSVPVSTVYHNAPTFIRPVRDIGRFLRQIWRRLWY